MDNKYNLPEPILKAITGGQGDYTTGRGETDFSVTQLIKPPAMVSLLGKHKDEIEEDASDLIFILLGTSIHKVLEHSSGDGALVEHRARATILDKVISGQADHFDTKTGIMSDYKVTSVWSVIFGHEEWEQQLNMLAYLFHLEGYHTKQLQIVAILRDWQKSKAKEDPKYPQSACVVVPIPIWGVSKTKAFIEERINMHLNVKEADFCSEKERWARPTTYAVKRKGVSKAVKVCKSMEEAEFVIKEGFTVDPEKASIEVRKGVDTKCISYCSVCKWCPYGKQYVQ